MGLGYQERQPEQIERDEATDRREHESERHNGPFTLAPFKWIS